MFLRDIFETFLIYLAFINIYRTTDELNDPKIYPKKDVFINVCFKYVCLKNKNE